MKALNLKIPKLTLMAARKNKGLTQVEAAKRIGVGLSTLQSWERGVTYPDQPEIELICALYEVSYDCLKFCPRNPLKADRGV